MTSIASKIGLALAVLGLSTSAAALEIEQSETKYRDKLYQLTLVVVLDAPQAKVQAVLFDYENYPKLDPRILETKIVGRPAPHEVLLYTKLRACFGVFCRNVKRVERVQEQEGGLKASVLPEQSEVTSGETSTLLTALDGRTRISYSTSMAPGFWIPPFVGRQLMLRTLREASLDLFRRVEQQSLSKSVAHAPAQ